MPDTSDDDMSGVPDHSQAVSPSILKSLGEDSNPLEMIGQTFGRSNREVDENYFAAHLSYRSDMSEEEEMKRLGQGAAKINEGFNQYAHEAQPHILRAFNDATAMLPPIVNSLEQGVIGGTLSAGANLGTAGAVGAAVSRINPIAGAVIGLGAEATAFDAGALAGSTKSIWEQSAGDRKSVV